MKKNQHWFSDTCRPRWRWFQMLIFKLHSVTCCCGHREMVVGSYAYIGEVLCQKQVSKAETSNYIPQLLWDVIIWYLLLAQHSSFMIAWPSTLTVQNFLFQQDFPKCLTFQPVEAWWHIFGSINRVIIGSGNAVSCLAPYHYVTYWWFIVGFTPTNKLQWNLKHHTETWKSILMWHLQSRSHFIHVSVWLIDIHDDAVFATSKDSLKFLLKFDQTMSCKGLKDPS